MSVRPANRAAKPATTGSSAFRTATPSAGSASTGSAEASTIRSHEPKISRWATPTFVTTTTLGWATAQSSVRSPARRAPISATTTSVSAGAPRIVTGRPTSLLNDWGLACVRKRVAEDRGGHVLRRGLAVRARDPHDRGGHAQALVGGELQQRLVCRAHADGGTVHAQSVAHEHAGGAVAERLRHEATAVRALTREGHEEIAWTRRARVDAHRRHLDVLAQEQPVHRARQVRHPARFHDPPRRATSASRATSRSSKSIVDPASS